MARVWLLLAGMLVAVHGDCVNVDDGPSEGGDETCFATDEEGMVCGWDGQEGKEAYCTRDGGGVLVCARAGPDGGRCKKGEVPPTKQLSADVLAKKEQMHKLHKQDGVNDQERERQVGGCTDHQSCPADWFCMDTETDQCEPCHECHHDVDGVGGNCRAHCGLAPGKVEM